MISKLSAVLLAGAFLLAPLSAKADVANPVSTLQRPNDTNPYAQNDLIASNVTAGSVVVPTFSIINPNVGVEVRRVRLSTNKTSGWDGTTFIIRLWNGVPTYTNGDNGVYAVATGGTKLLCTFSMSLSQFTDAAAGVSTPSGGSDCGIQQISGSVIGWDIQYTGSSALTPAAQQTFTLTPELKY
jgi:hypothetical protein